MVRPSGGLLLRIYLISTAQVLLVAGAVALVGWLTFKPTFRGGFAREAEFAMAGLREKLADQAALERDLARIKKHLGASVSFYREGRLIATNDATDAEHAASRAAVLAVQRGEEIREDGPPRRFVFALNPSEPALGYAVYRASLPPHPPLDRTLATLVIGLIVAAIASVVIARSFVQPLSALTRLAHTLGSGDLTARARTTRRDEFGQLAAAFDDMAERLTLLLQSQQELLANVSHELRTPLARIRVALDLATEGDATMAQEAVREITTDLVELERLVADVLQTAKLDLAAGRAGGGLPRLREKRIGALELVDQAAARFRHAHRERELAIVRDAEDVALTGDATLLRRALDNLLENARAYSDEDQPVRLEARKVGDALSFAVIDRGIGIAESDLPNITKPFFRTDPSRARRTGGLGLGLSLARRIAEAHGGRLEIESKLGVGTTVRLLIPTAPAA